MYNKLIKLDFGLQMIIVVVLLFVTSETATYTLGLLNKVNESYFNLCVIFSFLLLIFQMYVVYLAIRLAVHHLKSKDEE